MVSRSALVLEAIYGNGTMVVASASIPGKAIAVKFGVGTNTYP